MKRLMAARSWLERHAALLLFLTCLLLVAAIFARGVHLRMHEVVHARLEYYDLPSAVSMCYHHGTPYTMYMDVPPLGTDERVRQAITTPLTHPERVRLFPGDDKGMLDIVLLAFSLFGPNIEGIFFTTVLLLLATVLAFFADLRQRPAFCLVPVCILGGIYAAMPALLLTREVYSLTNPRVFEFLGLIPAAHLALALLDRAAFSWTRLAALAWQVVIIVECVHVRCTALWLVFATLALYALLVAVQLVRQCSAGRLGSPNWRPLLASAWVVVLLLTGLGGLKVYQRLVYPAAYYTTHLQHRIVWHNAGIGLALHPKLARLYGLRVNDISMIELVMKRLEDRKDRATYEAIWGANDDWRVLDNRIAKNYQPYEVECRAAVLDIMRAHPMATVQLFAYYKPLVAVRTLVHAAGLHHYNLNRLYLEDQGAALATPAEISVYRLRVRLREMAWLTLGLFLVCVCCRIRGRALVAPVGVLLGLLAWSFFPAACAYPLLHILGVSILAATGAVALLVVATLTTGLDLLIPRLPLLRTAAADTQVP